MKKLITLILALTLIISCGKPKVEPLQVQDTTTVVSDTTAVVDTATVVESNDQPVSWYMVYVKAGNDKKKALKIMENVRKCETPRAWCFLKDGEWYVVVGAFKAEWRCDKWIAKVNEDGYTAEKVLKYTK